MIELLILLVRAWQQFSYRPSDDIATARRAIKSTDRHEQRRALRRVVHVCERVVLTSEARAELQALQRAVSAQRIQGQEVRALQRVKLIG